MFGKRIIEESKWSGLGRRGRGRGAGPRGTRSRGGRLGSIPARLAAASLEERVPHPPPPPPRPKPRMICLEHSKRPSLRSGRPHCSSIASPRFPRINSPSLRHLRDHRGMSGARGVGWVRVADRPSKRATDRVRPDGAQPKWVVRHGVPRGPRPLAPSRPAGSDAWRQG